MRDTTRSSVDSDRRPPARPDTHRRGRRATDPRATALDARLPQTRRCLREATDGPIASHPLAHQDGVLHLGLHARGQTASQGWRCAARAMTDAVAMCRGGAKRVRELFSSGVGRSATGCLLRWDGPEERRCRFPGSDCTVTPHSRTASHHRVGASAADARRWRRRRGRPRCTERCRSRSPPRWH